MPVDLVSYTPQEVINLFQALEKLQEADVVHQRVGAELSAKARISLEDVALLRVHTITGGEVGEAQQQGLNKAGQLLRDILVTEVRKISQENYPAYLLKLFSIIQALEGTEVAQAIDNQIQSHAGVSWSNIALNRVDINEGHEIPEARTKQIRAAGVYLTSVLNTLLDA